MLYHNREMMFQEQKIKISSLMGYKPVHDGVFDSK